MTEIISASLKGPVLYRKAKKMIPGGTQLLSKRPEMFLPENWPSYYTRARGVEVWDVDGLRYGYELYGNRRLHPGVCRPECNMAVKLAIENGSMCTLNCPEELELAELLCELHPWAGMVRYPGPAEKPWP